MLKHHHSTSMSAYTFTDADFVTVTRKSRSTKSNRKYSQQPHLIPEEEFHECYETIPGESQGWLNISKLSKMQLDVAKMIIRGIFTRYENDKRSGVFRAPQIALLYVLRVQILLRAFLPNDRHYKHARVADHSKHLGRVLPRSAECAAVMDGFDRALALQARGDPAYMQIFTDTDRLFWHLRYKRWMASGAQYTH